MNENENSVPEKTLETMAKSFFRESTQYGFKKIDFLRFVNFLLDIALKNGDSLKSHTHPPQPAIPDLGAPLTCLPLQTERLIIRPFDTGDMDMVQKWLTDQSSLRFLLSRSTANSINLERIQKDVLLGIVTLQDERPIGAVAFLDINTEHHRAEIRKLIGDKEYRGRGFAKEATRAWLNYGVQALGLRKIYLNTLDTNIRNIRLNEEIGFKFEGILRNEVFFNEEFHDVLRMGLFFED